MANWKKPTQQFWREWKADRMAMIERGFTIKKIKGVWLMRNRYEDARAQAEMFPIVVERSDDGLMPDDPHSQYPGVDMSVLPWD